MASLYLKAALLTAAIALLGFFFISQLDAMRTNEIKSAVDELVLQTESERQMFLYWQVLGNSSDELCSYFSDTTGKRAERTYDLSQKISYYEKSNIMSQEYEMLKNQYYVSNAGLYLNLMAAEKYCEGSPYTKVLFFYRVNEDCPECMTQGGVLDNLRAAYPNLRVFAFPYDTNQELVKMLVKRHSITSAPALVIDDREVLRGFADFGTIEARLKARSS